MKKADPVLAASLILAVISMFWVKPSPDYLTYIDFRVLGILLSLMLVMAGLQKNGLFEFAGSWLLERCRNMTQLCIVLTFLCFFSSMLITNDVVLITFVPFAIMTLRRSGKGSRLLIPVIVSQTLGANLGSMLTPLGNPQNLYLYDKGGYTPGAFVMILLPYTVVSGILLLGFQFLLTGKEKTVLSEPMKKNDWSVRYPCFWKNTVYGILFLLCLLVVFRILPFYVILGVIVLAVLCMDAGLLLSVDYSLLLTFTFFFLFTGNLGKIEAVRTLLGRLVQQREIGIAWLTSQLISNVPATLLLSDFVTDFKALLIGVDLGGLGTLIASMASLISYKQYAGTEQAQKGKYILFFTVMNLLFLVVLLAVHAGIGLVTP